MYKCWEENHDFIFCRRSIVDFQHVCTLKNNKNLEATNLKNLENFTARCCHHLLTIYITDTRCVNR